jgi:hypothetical protein
VPSGDVPLEVVLVVVEKDVSTIEEEMLGLTI